MSTEIRKAIITGFGDESNITVTTATLPPPSKSEVQIRVLYSGFGGGDIQMRMGTYPFQRKFPLTPGYCCVGRVQVNGPNCHKFYKGDLVACLSVYDAEAELANLPEKYLIPMPAGLDLQQATALILDWSTAYGLVERAGKVSEGQRVFIHGLSGAVGMALVHLCKLKGAEIYGTASESNHAALRELGATPFVYSNKNWMVAIKAIGGAHVVFDALGYESWDESWDIVAPEGGILVGYGGNLPMLTGQKRGPQMVQVAKLTAWGMIPMCPKKTKFYYVDRDQPTFEPDLRTLFEMCREGKIKVPIKKVWGLEDVPEVHRNWTKGPGMGSVLIKVNDDVHG